MHIVKQKTTINHKLNVTMLDVTAEGPVKFYLL